MIYKFNFILVGLLLTASLILSTLINKTYGAEIEAVTPAYKLNIHLFYSYTCPHCEKERQFLDKIKSKYPDLIVTEYELLKVPSNLDLLQKVGKTLKANIGGVPFLVIGKDVTIGFGTDETTGVEIEKKIIEALKSKPEDIVGQIIKTGKIIDIYKSESSLSSNMLNIPILGNIDPKNISIPLLTIIFGLLDGINPCAMWALLFLISMLLGTKNRLRMWILGITFIATSGFMYFLFMTAWLNFFLFIGYSPIIKTAIGFAAAEIGLYYFIDYFKNKRGGCEVMANTKRQKYFEQIKKIAQKKEFGLAIGGTILLAAAVNIVELLCSAGFPAIYTNVLSMNQLPTWQYYSYLALYNFLYVLSDIIVFVIAMITLEAVGIENKWSRWSHLIAGIVMLLLGILMLFKPELLMLK